MPKGPTENEKAAWEKNPAFAQAARESKQLLKLPSNEELLDLYGLYKVSCNEDISGENFFPKGRPGVFNIRDRYKFDNWTKVIEQNLTQDEAMERYIAKVGELKETYGFDPNKEPEAVGSSRS
ncbi:acyl CoA binding protein-domain-containing protein [Xylariaceae sp. AK1471]|nr:acyl CoA binding protein-domain-containing protein [Xylariaceae sp. AK1471]